MIPIVGFWAFQAGMELISFLRRGGQPKKSSRRKLAEAFGSTRATKLDTKQGVKFEDVAGIYSHALSFYWSAVEYIPMLCPSIGQRWSIFPCSFLLLVSCGVYSQYRAQASGKFTEVDPKGWSTVPVTALGSVLGKPVPRIYL
jgi:hypothetical protein